MQQKSISDFLAGLDLTAITISNDGRVLLHNQDITETLKEHGLDSAAAASAQARGLNGYCPNNSQCGKALA